MRLRLAAAPLAFTMALVACSGDDGGGARTAIDEDAGAMVQALSLAPAGDDTTIAIVADYAAAGEALDLDRPEPGADDDELADWFISLTTGRDAVAGGLQASGQFSRNVLEDEAWRNEVGWAPIDVDLSVDVQFEDAQGYYGYVGDFDPDGIDEAVNDEDNVWADEIHVEEQNGVEYYTWGDDPAETDPDRLTTVRPIGQGSNMAVLDGALLWAVETNAIEDGIDAATGEADSMADDDELGTLAEAMDDAGAVGALFSADGHAFDDPLGPGASDEQVAEFEEELEDVPTLDPYEAFATGVRIEDGEPKMVIALLHDDEEVAEDNADNLETVIDEGQSLVTNAAWRDRVRLEDIEVDGPMLVATLDLDDGSPNLWVALIYNRDNLLYAR
jgi:hypothetical protein